MSPVNTTSDKKLKKDIKEANAFYRENQKQIIQEAEYAFNQTADEPRNFKIMAQKSVDFSKKLDFYSTLPILSEGFLQYKFFEKFENLMIYAIANKSTNDLSKLSDLADEHLMRYVVTFPKVRSFYDKKMMKTTISVRLFDNEKGKFVLDKNFTGDSINPGFEFTCENGTISCTLNNALAPALYEIIQIVAENNPTIIKEKSLAIKREQVLFDQYYPKEPNISIKNVIANTDTSLSLEGYYHGFMNENKTAFIGFFAQNGVDESFKSLQNKKDKSVQIFTNDITDIENIPQVYAYVVVGVLQNSTWYLKKDKVTYFNAENFELAKKGYFNNLQAWNFFKKDSDEYNPDFWNSYFFAREESAVAANKKDIDHYTKLLNEPGTEEDKKIYQDIIDDYYEKDLKNDIYIGEYKIIASVKKEQDRISNKVFEEQLSTDVISPFFDNYIQTSGKGILEYKKSSKTFTLIYAKNKQVVLCPILLNFKNGESKLTYFAFLKNGTEYDIYEWEYFEPITPEYKNSYSGTVHDQIRNLTIWNFSFDYLSDIEFWSKYVLFQNDSEYVYLKKIN